MLNSKLIDIFLILNKKEMKLLGKFIYSPVYNQHKDVTALFEYLVSLAALTDENLSKQTIYKVLYGKEKYDDLRLRHVVSYLMRVCEDCLAYLERDEDPNQHRLNLLKAYRKRGLKKHFENDFLLLKKGIRESSKKSSASYLAAAQINEEASAASIAGTNADTSHLLEADTALTFYFILTKLKNGCKLLAYSRDVLLVKQLFLPEIISTIEKNTLQQHPEIESYYCAYLAFENAGEISYYKTFKDKLAALALRIETDELKGLFALAIQYCKNKLQDGFREFERELFEIYLHGLASEALLTNQTLSFETQKSIVDLGLLLREVSWVEDFILDSKHLTDANLREDLFRLNAAKVYYAKANYVSCLKTLGEEKIKHISILLDAQRLKIQTLQELKDTAQLKVENQKLREMIQKQ